MSARGRATITVTVTYSLDDGGETGRRVVEALEAQIRAGVDTMKLLIDATDTQDSRRIHELEVDVVQWRAGA